MNRSQEVKPFQWPTEEPVLPPKPEAPAARAVEEPAPAPAPPHEARQPPPLICPEDVEDGSTHAFLWHHAAAAAAVVRTIIQRDEGGPADGPLAGLSSRQLVAALMAGLGWDVGGVVLGELHGEAERRWVARAVTEEPEVTHATALHALQHVRERVEAGDYLERGGPALAEALLSRAFGGRRVAAYLRDEDESGFYLLRGAAAEQMAPFISHEHPQTIALLLSQLDPHLAAAILSLLSERMQSDVAYRMTVMDVVTPMALQDLEEALEASLADILSGSHDVGGPKVVADVLNLTGSSVERKVLNALDKRDPEIGEAVRNLMFTFADIDKMTDQELSLLLDRLDPEHLAIALKASQESLKARLLGLLPEDRRSALTAEMERLGPMRLAEVEDVQLRIVAMVRQMEEQGEATIVRGDPDPYV